MPGFRRKFKRARGQSLSSLQTDRVASVSLRGKNKVRLCCGGDSLEPLGHALERGILAAGLQLEDMNKKARRKADKADAKRSGKEQNQTPKTSKKPPAAKLPGGGSSSDEVADASGSASEDDGGDAENAAGAEAELAFAGSKKVLLGALLGRPVLGGASALEWKLKGFPWAAAVYPVYAHSRLALASICAAFYEEGYLPVSNAKTSNVVSDRVTIYFQKHDLFEAGRPPTSPAGRGDLGGDRYFWCLCLHESDKVRLIGAAEAETQAVRTGILEFRQIQKEKMAFTPAEQCLQIQIKGNAWNTSSDESAFKSHLMLLAIFEALLEGNTRLVATVDAIDAIEGGSACYVLMTQRSVSAGADDGAEVREGSAGGSGEDEESADDDGNGEDGAVFAWLTDVAGIPADTAADIAASLSKEDYASVDALNELDDAALNSLGVKLRWRKAILTNRASADEEESEPAAPADLLSAETPSSTQSAPALTPSFVADFPETGGTTGDSNLLLDLDEPAPANPPPASDFNPFS